MTEAEQPGTGGAGADDGESEMSGEPGADRRTGSLPRADRPPALRFEDGFERVLAWSRILLLVPVVVLVLSAAVSFAYGTDVFVSSVGEIIGHPQDVDHKLDVFLTEIDLFLIGATLIIAAFGLYELFISRITPGGSHRPLPGWLEMKDLNDLKARVISMIILVAAVSFVDVVVRLGEGLQVLYLGGGIALVIAALTAFLRFGA
jgi:uncharacterized protein (TIGR00645 family)